MASNLEECIEYFRKNAYKRVFQKMRTKYESYGKWEGNITLEHPTRRRKREFKWIYGKKLL